MYTRALPLLLLGLAAQEPPRFVPETLGPVEIGYGVALGESEYAYILYTWGGEPGGSYSTNTIIK